MEKGRQTERESERERERERERAREREGERERGVKVTPKEDKQTGPVVTCASRD